MAAYSGAAFLLKGLVVGFSIAAPVGPIGVLCIRRTLAYGRLSGLVSGLGAATADSLYGAVAGFGLTAVSGLLMRVEPVLRIVGGLFLLYLGLRSALSRPAQQAASAKDEGPAADYLTTFLLTLTNPITIISYAAIFAGLGIVTTGGSTAAAALLVLGIFLGSAAWWLILSGLVAGASHWVTPRVLRWVNLGSGVVIAAFGAAALAGVLR